MRVLRVVTRGPKPLLYGMRRAQASACALCFDGLMTAVVVCVATLSVAAAAETTLLDAAERGDRAAALQVLATGADPNAPGPDGTTALMYAAANDDVELVRALIRAGANVKMANKFGTSAITEA